MSEEKESKQSAKALIKEIKRRTNRHYSTEEKIRIVIEGLRGEESAGRIAGALVHGSGGAADGAGAGVAGGVGRGRQRGAVARLE